MKRWWVLIGALLLSLAAWAVPTVDQVQAEVARGDHARAESMMREVVAARPSSARAQYVLAEVLAHNGKLDEAQQAVQRARQLDPKIGFTAPDKFAQFEQQLQRAQRAAAAPQASPRELSTTAPAAIERPRAVAPAAPRPAASGGGIPGWAFGLGGAVIALLVWRMLAARRRAAAMQQQAGMDPRWAGQGGMPGTPAGGAGGGLMGAGLAGLGGFGLGMLADRMLRGDDAHAAGTGQSAEAGAGGQGGLVPGLFDDAGDVTQRPIDFGGGDGWDGGGGGDAGGGDGW
ncbi:tetratricopeptide repeat protein [Aquincola sp. S2]|uniref:Tetratricopeptide repeat protein n=1 Tax=Pseudaquabacterium terrae TaxID=2732868 RepID=A0ABX2EL14_9BURK|nr:tetratricopeptide repeat protein [Aquabacterium terrae]NRF69320.1 tetratricopeptide repeat protein [Aquabacterium terrae]